jgi:hypothetical protein
MTVLPKKVEESITDFVFEAKVEESTIEKYRGKIPNQMIEVWEKFGYGTILNGYLKIVNPDDYIELMLESSVRDKELPVLFTTGMGDLLVWDSKDVGFLRKLDFKHQDTETVNASFKYFLENTHDEWYQENKLKWNPYPEALKMYGPLAYDECFGYVPILGIGGSEKVEKLKKVKLYEHIGIHVAFMGPLF